MYNYLWITPYKHLMKKNLTLYLSCLFLLTANLVHAQAPSILWQKCLGGHMGDYGQYIEPTSDGGYIMTGYTASNDGDVSGNHGLDDYWVVKLNSTGAVQWQKCLGGNSEDRANVIHQTPDGGYIVAGSSFSPNNGDVTGNHNGMDYWVVKLSNTGVIQWQKSLGGSKNEYAYSIQLTTDGGYIVAGLTESNDGDVTGNHGGRDVWIVKLSSTGVMQWQKTYGGSQDEEAYYIQLAADGGYIVTGYTQSNDGDVSGNHGKTDFWVIKVSSTGALQWQKCLGGTLYETGWCVQATPDGGYVVAGVAGSNDGDVSGNHTGLAVGFSDYWIVKLSSTGAIQWQKCLGGDYNETAYTIQLTPDGGYVVAGYAESVNGDVTCHDTYHDYWVVKLNGTGVMQWAKDMGGSGTDEAYSIAPTADGGYIVSGMTSSKELSGYHTDYASTVGDVWVIKLGPPQAAPAPPSVTISPHNPVICPGSSLILSATPINPGVNFSYQWKKNGVNVGTNGAAYTDATLADQDVVTCELTTHDCNTGTLTVSDQVVVKVGGALPVIHIDASLTTICSGANVVFMATVTNPGTANFLYQWTINGVSTGTNSNTLSSSTLHNGDVVACAYSDNNPCISGTSISSNTIAMQVITAATPAVSIAASQTKICAGTAVTFTATSTYAGTNVSYQWTVNGAPAGTNSPSFNTAALPDGATVSCTLLADPALPCLTSSSAVSNGIVMAVTPARDPTVSISAPKNGVCAGTPLNFIAITADAGTSPSYQWKVNGANTGNNSLSFSSNALQNGDQVSCLLTPDKDACSTAAVLSDPVSMLIYALPDVIIDPADTTIKAGQTLTLAATIAGDFSTFEWQPAEQLPDPQSLTPVTLPMANSTTFTLKVINANGCSTRGKSVVHVIRPLVMPNAFTPNGDGKNDVFRIPPDVSLQLREFSIFDRWGHKVFSTRNIGQGWDGRINGQLSPPGVYVYFVDGVGEKGPVLLKGTLLLIR